MMILLSNDNLSRALHAPLYDRLYSFCTAYTPEIPAEPVVNSLLTRLYNSDPSLQILVTFDDKYNIIEHAVIEIQRAFGNTVIYGHQLQHDKPSVQAMDEFMEYLDKLKEQTGAICIAFTVVKNVRAYEKKYSYKVCRTVMLKTTAPINEA